MVMGGVNTLLTYIFYLFLLMLFSYTIAFIISYVSGIIISYFLNSLFVFESKVSLKKAMRFPIVYIVQFSLNLFLLWLLVDILKLQETIAPLVAIVFTIPITYGITKLVLESRK